MPVVMVYSRSTRYVCRLARDVLLNRPPRILYSCSEMYAVPTLFGMVRSVQKHNVPSLSRALCAPSRGRGASAKFTVLHRPYDSSRYHIVQALRLPCYALLT